ncbi:follistatin-related protein 1-like [Procambarus clarkii]|uniref:follistatin-related protein 1-like n=1 Tax=Procambarus clarkii TaxID=6728 RepID=UPI001E674716|nr:follistatin-related protein 1-like [Procambarus clarkii]
MGMGGLPLCPDTQKRLGCDADKDNYVNSDELLNCTSGSFFLAHSEQENVLTRALCIDAIVDVADNNHDLTLDFEEFTRMLNPDFRPAHKLCLLDGMKYDDGEDVYVDGNLSISLSVHACACARVCTCSWVYMFPDTSKDRNSEFGGKDFDTITLIWWKKIMICLWENIEEYLIEEEDEYLE